MIPRMLPCLAALLAATPTWAQTCNPNTRATAPDSRFAYNAKRGTVLDKATGLMWKRCVEGLSGAGCATGSATRTNWGNALTLAADSNYGGYTDWRLPNAKELESLAEDKCYSPAINLALFPNTPSDGHWSSSPDADYSDGAWIVDFGNGSSGYGYRDFNGAVRLVRGGQ